MCDVNDDANVDGRSRSQSFENWIWLSIYRIILSIWCAFRFSINYWKWMERISLLLLPWRIRLAGLFPFRIDSEIMNFIDSWIGDRPVARLGTHSIGDNLFQRHHKRNKQAVIVYVSMLSGLVNKIQVKIKLWEWLTNHFKTRHNLDVWEWYYQIRIAFTNNLEAACIRIILLPFSSQSAAI
jgi:hypothetical protein